MIGIIVLFFLAAWAAIAFFLSFAIAKAVVKTGWKTTLVFFMLFIPLLVLPIIDDFLIGIEFNKLCKEYSATAMDRESVRGRTVYLGDVVRTKINRGLMKANVKERQYLDAKTDELVIVYRHLRAGGGFLTSLAPDILRALTFKGTCEPDGRSFNIPVLEELEMTEIDNKDLELWRKENANN